MSQPLYSPLPRVGLPDFEGATPSGVDTKITGAGQRIERALYLEERLVVLAEVEVTNVAHTAGKGGVRRSHTMQVRDLYELPGKEGRRQLARLRTSFRQARDEALGRTALPVFDDTSTPECFTDASGVLLTPEELAEKQGLQIDLDIDGVVLVFGDGQRGLWPHDWEGLDQSLGIPGQTMRRPNSSDAGDVAQVRQWLDPDSGEVIDEWSEEDEDARLEAVEESLAGDEAEADEGEGE